MIQIIFRFTQQTNRQTCGLLGLLNKLILHAYLEKSAFLKGQVTILIPSSVARKALFTLLASRLDIGKKLQLLSFNIQNGSICIK